jgi:hypothetical protein
MQRPGGKQHAKPQAAAQQQVKVAQGFLPCRQLQG